MNLKVRERIGIAMTLVVLANLVAAAVTGVYFYRTAEYRARLADSTATAQATARAAQSLSEFSSATNGYALALTTRRVTDIGEAYDRLGTADAQAQTAMHDLVGVGIVPPSKKFAEQWSDLRRAALIYLNTQAGAYGVTDRLGLTAAGRVETTATPVITPPAYFTGLYSFSLVDQAAAVRIHSEDLRDRMIGPASVEAAKRADAATAAEAQARGFAQAATLALALLSLLVAVIAGVWVYRGTVPPLEEATAFADRVAAGDLQATFGTHRGDEIGHLTQAIENMKDAVVRDLSALREMAGAVLFTAEGVSESAHSVLRRRVETGGVAADDEQAHIADIARRADDLSELSRHMLEA